MKRPTVTRGLLVEGELFWKNQRPYVRRKTRKQALLFLQTKDLCFSCDVSVRLPITNVWPGAETLTTLRAQAGRRNESSQAQLITIDEGTPLFVADQRAHYMQLEYVDGCLKTQWVDARLFAQYLVQRAERMPNQTHQALLWTLGTLRALDCPQYWTRNLADALAEKSTRRV